MKPQINAKTEFYNRDDIIVADEEDENWSDDLTLIIEDQTLSFELRRYWRLSCSQMSRLLHRHELILLDRCYEHMTVMA